MKIIILSLVFVLSLVSVNAQESNQVSVEESLYGIQTGVLGFWGHTERRLANKIALRAEIGLDAALFGGSIYFEDNRINYAFTPVITIEPRWYYNIGKRFEKGKAMDKNSANFFTISFSYNPDLFVISNVDNVNVFNQIRIVPKWAIKRTIAKHLTYEAGIGLGYRYAFFDEQDYFFPPDKGSAVLDLHIRLGYSF